MMYIICVAVSAYIVHGYIYIYSWAHPFISVTNQRAQTIWIVFERWKIRQRNKRTAFAIKAPSLFPFSSFHNLRINLRKNLYTFVCTHTHTPTQTHPYTHRVRYGMRHLHQKLKTNLKLIYCWARSVYSEAALEKQVFVRLNRSRISGYSHMRIMAIDAN